jgi:hypothetical protein
MVFRCHLFSVACSGTLCMRICWMGKVYVLHVALVIYRNSSALRVKTFCENPPMRNHSLQPTLSI